MNNIFVFSVLLLLSFSSFLSADNTIWSDCGFGDIRFKQFTLFPNPVQVGQSVHVLAVVNIIPGVNAGDVVNGSLSINVKYNKDSTGFTLTNIPLCGSIDAINCATIASGDNTISFDFNIPELPAGQYDIAAYFSPNAVSQTGCVSFTVTVEDSTQHGQYLSYVTAQLAGQAQFENTNYLDRTLGEIVQVGPVGVVSPVYSYLYPWGTFISVDGSQDVVQQNFDTTGYVWGMSGNMTEMYYQNTTRSQIFRGTFSMGWVSSATKKTIDVPIMDGIFMLRWDYTTDTSTGIVSAAITGTLSFSDVDALPLGWTHAVTLERFGSLEVSSSTQGVMIVQGSKDYCLTSTSCTTSTVIPGKTKQPLSKRNLGLIIGLCVGVPLVILIVVALFFLRRHQKRNEEEDGIFSAARKPEYGNALVVDDIIQETREHGGNNTLIPRLDRHPGDTESEYDSSESEEELARGRGRGRGRSESPATRSEISERQERPPRYASRSRDDRQLTEDDSYSDAGSSASREDDEE